MNRLVRPAVLLPAGLLLLAAGGTWLLTQPACAITTERDWSAYGDYAYWRSAFDATSAVCNVGLLTRDLAEDYTSAGRWTLLALGHLGLLLYVLLGWSAARRLFDPQRTRLPSPAVVLAALVAAEVVVVFSLSLVDRATGGTPTWTDSAWNLASGFASLGWSIGEDPAAVARRFPIYAGLIGTLAPVGLLLIRAGELRRNRIALAMLGYFAWLALAAAVVVALEQPRGGTAHRRPGPAGTAPGAPATLRWSEQVAAAAGAGLAVEPLADRAASEGTLVVLAGAVLVGGFGGGSGGGIHWLLLVYALAGCAALVGRGPARSDDPVARRGVVAGVSCAVSVLGLALAVAMGLLVIERMTASPYQAAPTFASAFLEASSAVGGAGLSTGVTASLTSPILSSGIRQSVDQYQYGMVWLIAAMIAGRIVPVLILSRVAALRFRDAPAELPPLA